MKDEKLMQVVYMAVRNLFHKYFTRDFEIDRPVTSSLPEVCGEVLSVTAFQYQCTGYLALQSTRTGAGFYYTSLTGHSAVTELDEMAAASAEFLNLLAGMVKRHYDRHQLVFSFSLPTTWLDGKANHLPDLGAEPEIYRYQLHFKSCSSFLWLVMSDSYSYNNK